MGGGGGELKIDSISSLRILFFKIYYFLISVCTCNFKMQKVTFANNLDSN